MNLKKYLRVLYQPGIQVYAFIKLSAVVRKVPVVGKMLSILIDNFILYVFSLEVTSHSIHVASLIIGHSTGVVLGGNGIRSNGVLHINSGVVFARRFETDREHTKSEFFEIDGDLTVGANSVLLGPLFIKGPTIIGALSLVTKDILVPGVYVGSPARKIRDI